MSGLPEILSPEDDDRKDVRVIIKVKNAFILRKMEELGIPTVAELSRRSGVLQNQLCELLNMKSAARANTKDRRWRKVVERLATSLKCLPEDLFSEQQQYHKLTKNTSEVDVSSSELYLMLGEYRQSSPEDIMIRDELRGVISGLLMKLPPRVHRIISERFGLDGSDGKTYEQVAEEFGITRERVRQIEARGLRHLQHPNRRSKLKPYLSTLNDGIKR